MENEKPTKEERERLYEKYAPYMSKPGEGASLFDDWNEMAPGFLDRCSIPDPMDGTMDHEEEEDDEEEDD